MTKYAISLALLATLALAGCKSAEQKAEDLNKEYYALTDQYLKDCQEADYKVYSPEEARQHQYESDAKLNSPHCKQLDEKRTKLLSRILTK